MPKYTVTYRIIIYFNNCAPLEKEEEITFEHDGDIESAKKHFEGEITCGIDDTQYVNDDYIDNITSSSFDLLEIYKD